jgi:hypothetical protein
MLKNTLIYFIISSFVSLCSIHPSSLFSSHHPTIKTTLVDTRQQHGVKDTQTLILFAAQQAKSPNPNFFFFPFFFF